MIQCNPCFLAKTQLPETRPKPLVLLPLPGVGSELLLCPVRAVTIYLEKTDSLNHSDRLLVRWASKRSDLFPQTISTWIRRVIREAYDHAGVPIPPMRRACHEVRAIAASFAYMHNVSLTDLLETVGWTTASTFGTFYLRDVSQTVLSVQGPLPAAHCI